MLSRDLQINILTALLPHYPKRIEVCDFKNKVNASPDDLLANVFYLAEHKLVEVVSNDYATEFRDLAPSDDIENFYGFYIRITHIGVDEIADEEGESGLFVKVETAPVSVTPASGEEGKRKPLKDHL
ncbi:hypothetical protein [Pseudogulbenkiania ferrooxidans]|uniref:Uncharacterized protein n=1 Tax=Pseudogulbenkiania ferrooxidans EGD-HP2 TaxID=1388764 RepID=A0ABP2XN34_9NEIS|nr:hypothetical protein [Pseudogulbenkiania ferrooxidans]ERE07204.1 hypothetical protein O166_06470 [Pseudogulbenkiania ferrooxidans EGD-HP2]